MLSRSGSNWMIDGERASADEVEAYVRALERAVKNTARSAQNNGQSTTQWSWKSFGWGLVTAFIFWLISTAGGWGWFGRLFGGLFNMVRDLLAFAIIVAILFGIGYGFWRLFMRRPNQSAPSRSATEALRGYGQPTESTTSTSSRPTTVHSTGTRAKNGFDNWLDKIRENLDASRGTRSPRR